MLNHPCLDTLDNRQHTAVMPEGRKANKVSPQIATAHCLEFQSAAQQGRTQTMPGELPELKR